MGEWRKTRSKRVWIVALTVALALFIAACGEEKEEEPAGGGDQSASGGGGRTAARSS